MASVNVTGKWDSRYVVSFEHMNAAASFFLHCLLALEANLSWCTRYSGPIVHDTSYYAKAMLGGALACGGTHAAITPLDVTKCNMQVRAYPLRNVL